VKVARLLESIASLFNKSSVANHFAKDVSALSDETLHGNEADSYPEGKPEAAKSRLLGNAESPVDLAVHDQNVGFEEKLSLLLRTKNDLLAGSLELIGLEEIRGALGDKWELLAERVINLAQKELRRSLDPSDFFRRHGAASFLIHFGCLDKAAAEEKTRITAIRIKAALIEQVPDVAQAIAVRPFVAEVSSSTLEQAGSSLSDALFSRLARMRIETMAELRERRNSLSRDVSVLFSPIWDRRREIAILNRCLVDLSYYRTLSAQLRELSDPDEIENFAADVDYLVLAKSIEALHKQRLTKAVLLIPIDFATIQNQTSAKEYTRLLEAMPRAYRKMVVMEVRNVDSDVSPEELYQAIERVARLVKAWIIELAFDDRRISEILAKGVWAIATNLNRPEGSMDRSLTAQLQRFTASCGDNVNTLASGANSIGLAQAAYNAGFTLIEGTAIHLPSREPRQGVRLRVPSLPYLLNRMVNI
jgi:hypothetical protein